MARLKKSRSMRGKLGKTGSKEAMKEQKKARKASASRRFVTKKAKERKEQAYKKLERLGLLPEKEEAIAPARPRRFVFVKPKKIEDVSEHDENSKDATDLPEPSVDDLISEFTESH